jgi:hypothetical protein
LTHSGHLNFLRGATLMGAFPVKLATRKFIALGFRNKK